MDKDSSTDAGEPALFAGAAWFDPIAARSEERSVGKEWRYRRDWSSDVCSSDLHSHPRITTPAGCRRGCGGKRGRRSLRLVQRAMTGVGAPAETTPWTRIAALTRASPRCSPGRLGSTRSKPDRKSVV